MWIQIRFLVGLCAALLLASGIWAAFFCQMLGYRAPGDAVNILAWYEKKADLANRIHSPKVIIIGGSSVLYGINAAQLSEAWGVPVLNYGVHAGLPLNYILHKAREFINPGDFVILCLEYELFVRGNLLNQTAIRYYLGGDPGYVQELTFSEQLQCFFNPSWTEFRQLLKDDELKIQNRVREMAKNADEIMNAHGDRVGHSKSSMSEEMRASIVTYPALRSILKPTFSQNESVWNEIGDFVVWCQRHNAKVAAIYANTIDTAEFHTPPATTNLQRLKDKFAEVQVPVFGNGTEAFRPREDFYDTQYHLTEEGQLSRTRDLEPLLRPAIRRWQNSGE